MAKPQASDTGPMSKKAFFLLIGFIALGIFATTLPQPQVLGKIPLQNLLKHDLKVPRAEMAKFFFICGVFWYIKPIAGILTDAFPLFKTRRRHYALLGTLFAALSWVVMMFLPRTYNSLLGGAVLINLFMVMVSTVVGAVLVEVGQSTGSTGRLTAVRQFANNASQLIQGPIGGLLASGSIAIAFGVNALFLLAFIPVAYFVLKEKPVATTRTDSLVNARSQLSVIGKSKTFWWALVFITLFYFAPGFSTLLYYRQNDVLKIDQQHIGFLSSLGGLGGIIGAVAYGFAARRFSLKSLLVFSIITAALATFIYLDYSSYSKATIIDFTNGLFFGFAEVAFIHLAARATPPGSEGLGYSLILSFRNVALFGADYLGSLLADQKHWSWDTMVILNGASTFLVIILLPFIPKIVMASKDSAEIAHSG